MNNIKITHDRIEIPLPSDAADSIVLEALKDTRDTILASIEQDMESNYQRADGELPDYIKANLHDNARYLNAVNVLLEYFGW